MLNFAMYALTTKCEIEWPLVIVTHMSLICCSILDAYGRKAAEDKVSFPEHILRVDVSLNELTELDGSSLQPFIRLKYLDASLNQIKQ